MAKRRGKQPSQPAPAKASAVERAAPGAPAGDIEAIVTGTHANPFAVLGPHRDAGGPVIRAFLPTASRAWVIAADPGGGATEMTRLHPAGFFAAALPGAVSAGYRLRLEVGGQLAEMEDPYRFGLVLGELDVHLLAEGDHRQLFAVMGAHPREMSGVAGTAFSVWAPNARRVSVVGEFNQWDGRVHPMRRRADAGVWELFLPGVDQGAHYKFEIVGADGQLLPLKSDPYAFAAELRPGTASRVHGLTRMKWRDEAWLSRRAASIAPDAPVSVYEVHLASWMRGPNNRWLTYEELGERLVPYVERMGFTHIELLPITEYPYDGSWGYQPTGLFAPTSRHGTPEDFARFVERAHEAGVGVLLDWVPGHFPTDAHGLAQFDGTGLYEHADPRQGFHRDWNTLIYNYGRREVTNFLLASALFWLRQFHLDGLRVDAVASMLYLDYSRDAGEWIPNRYGGNENLDAINFLRRLNTLAGSELEGATVIAEESTAWPGVSRPVHAGGLGFGYKWNMGWMNDTLRYMSREPIHRRWAHSDMTFGMLYAFSENFMLPLSHDEVVHGKGSILTRMPGDDWQRFANLRAYYGFMFGHPGKKLNFMGNEIAQAREWNFDQSLDWHLLEEHRHRGVQALFTDLNRLYRSAPALHALDCDPAGFEWLVENDNENSVLVFLRKGRAGDPPVLVACNFTPVPRHGYRVGVPLEGGFVERLNTDAAVYGGSNLGNGGYVAVQPVPSHGHARSVEMTLPPLATLFLEWGGGPGSSKA
jgi:1,4-alpha-glucan branching enzyme